jgi:hypothetical protein
MSIKTMSVGRGLIGLVSVVLLGATAAEAQMIQGKLQGSIDVGAVAAGGGKQTIVIKFPGKGAGSLTINLNIAPGATPDAVAQTIINAINKNFPGEAQLAPGSTTEIDLKFGRLDSQVGNAVTIDRDVVVKSAMAPVAPGDLLGVLAFDPNGSGDSTLASDMAVVASFSGGGPSVSFTAPAGDTLSELATLVNSELDANGFATQQIDATDIAIDLPSPLLPIPLEFDFGLNALGPVGDHGIDVALTPAVPEPVGLGVLGMGLAGLLAARRRQRP